MRPINPTLRRILWTLLASFVLAICLLIASAFFSPEQYEQMISCPSTYGMWADCVSTSYPSIPFGGVEIVPRGGGNSFFDIHPFGNYDILGASVSIRSGGAPIYDFIVWFIVSYILISCVSLIKKNKSLKNA